MSGVFVARDVHVDAVKSGLDSIKKLRNSLGDERIDLRGADLRNLDLRSAPLEDAQMNGCNLCGTKLDHADLTKASIDDASFDRATLRSARLASATLSNASLKGADLSDCDCTGANFTNAHLRDIVVNEKTSFQQANLQGAHIDPSMLSRCQIAGAHLASLDLSEIDLSSRHLVATSFSGCTLDGANFTDAILSRASFHGALRRRCVFVGATLDRASFNNANLDHANISRANFFEANLNSSSMEQATGAHLARNLLTTKIDRNGNVRYFETVVRPPPERWVDWERIRVVGRLPLFAASYAGLIVIPLYIYILDIYNQKIDALREWASRLPGDTAAILKHLHKEPVPDSFALLLASTICLAIASTIYALACPSRVKEYSADQWRYELGHSLVHYWPDAWKHRTLRLICASLYVVGGLGAGYILLTKLWRVAVILYRSS
jgi:uncharacterized protein YjbI with pentapeptide repeats